MRNVSVAAREWKGEVVFLRKLTAGGTSRSFGVEVAKLAGLPPAVIARARAILRTLEAPGGGAPADLPRPVVPGAAEAGVSQLGLFAPPPASPSAAPVMEDPAVREVLDRLRAVDADELSPRAAHDLLAELVRKLTAPS